MSTPEPKVEPDIDSIMKLLVPNGEIDNATKKQQEGMSELGAIYKRIEKDLRGNRGAVAFIRKLDKMSADKRNDFIRTLEPLLVERGYTLEVIDPEDLAAKAQKGDGEEGDAGAGPNGATSALDKAREKLSGDVGAEPGSEEPKQPSAQVKKYLALRRGGETREDAAETAGISLGEAELTDEAEARGEFAHVKGPSKPKLGIVGKSGDTVQ